MNVPYEGSDFEDNSRFTPPLPTPRMLIIRNPFTFLQYGGDVGYFWWSVDALWTIMSSGDYVDFDDDDDDDDDDDNDDDVELYTYIYDM